MLGVTRGTDDRRGRVLAPWTVYAPQEDTQLLVRALDRENVAGADVLDAGTGTGALALAAARRGARVTAVDTSLRAVLTTRLNARLARLPVEVRHGNLFAPVAGRRFNLIVTNPPYVPAPHAVRSHTAAVAWDAGDDGRLLVDRICRNAGALLRPGGVLLMVHSVLCGVAPTLRLLARSGLEAEVCDRMQVPFGPVLRSRQTWLRHRGILGTGDDKEELVIIRACRAR